MVLETLAMVLKTSMACVFRSHCTRVVAGGGVRLTPNQTPVIDHCIAAKTDMFGAAIESTSPISSVRTRIPACWIS